MNNPVLGGGRGRRRALRARLTLAQRLGAAAVLLGATGFAAATWPTSAAADAPVQTAWYNQMSGGGQAAPEPTTPSGGLHVAVASGQIAAWSAVQYTLAAGSTATLEFKVSNLTATPVVNPTSPSTTPAANVIACPITGTWKGGDDQPMADAPKYDCTHSIFGNLSDDQKTLTFFADAGLETLPGQLSLAIVPVVTDEIPGAGTPAPADTTQPFSLDLDKPDANSLTVTSTAAPPPPPPAPSKGGTTTTGTSAAGSPANSSGPANSGASVNLPGSTTSGTSPTATDTGSSPVVAPQNAAPATAPAAAAAPAKSDRAHNAALAMLLLIGIGLVAMSSGQMQRAPRLLGGSGRHAALAGDAAAAAAAAAPVMMTPYGTRGLGRFNKPRTEPARPLT